MSDSAPELSVILPVFNEAESITSVLEELVGVLEQAFSGRWEILAVDDGSRDRTADLIHEVSTRTPQIRLLQQEQNQGQSLALCAGFTAAKGEWIATLDADGQNDPADLPSMFEIRHEADAIFGYRADRKDTWSKRIASKLANGIRNLLLREKIKDSGCSLKLFKRSLTTALVPWDGMHRFLGTLFFMQGATIKQIPVNHRARTAGESKYTNSGRLKITWRHLLAIRKGPEGFLRDPE